MEHQGSFQVYEGYILRRVGGLKGWVSEYFKIKPAGEGCANCKTDSNLLVLGPETHREVFELDSQPSASHLASNGASLALYVEPSSMDPRNKDFIGFRLFKRESNEEIAQFRANDIVQMRRFMVSLGCEGSGLLSSIFDGFEGPIGTLKGHWDAIHPSEDEVYKQLHSLGPQSKMLEVLAVEESRPELTTTAPPSYENAVIGFSFPQDDTTLLAALPTGFPLPKVHRRPWDDSFRPPRGLAVNLPFSIGYGGELGLPDGMEAQYNPSEERYLFIDHINGITTLLDPRPPPKPTPVVPKRYYKYGERKRLPNSENAGVLRPKNFIGSKGMDHGEDDSTPHGLCKDKSVIEATAERALSRPHSFIVDASGSNGADGENGADGKAGLQGVDGLDAKSAPPSQGSNGRHGEPGHPGEWGVSGSPASHVLLNLSGDSNQLHVSGSCNLVANLGGDEAEGILFVNCRGGDGGCGGQGGSGGKGGDGGKGGCGGTEFNGGAPGGRGGDGGEGGKGGNGGNSGLGGMCVLEADDPSMLMLVDVDCRCGTAGQGGKGGAGGERGRGGRGGKAGGKKYARPGFGGNSGQSKPKADDGSDGFSANSNSLLFTRYNHGGVLWSVPSKNYFFPSRYDCKISHFKVTSESNDGVFEPNQRIRISGVTLVSSGGMPLPEGVSVVISSSKNINFERTALVLPKELPSGESYTFPTSLYGRIANQPSPNVPGLSAPTSAMFEGCAKLLGRSFEKSSFSQHLVVQYPVKLTHLKCPKSLGRGEVSIFEIGVENLSSKRYGSCDGSVGRLGVRLHMDARLVPVISTTIGFTAVPYTIVYDPNVRDSLYIEVLELPPSETIDLQVTIQMASRAELLDYCHWQADLCLREKVIEYNFEKVRIPPFFVPCEPPSDVLMVTSEALTRAEFVYWQRILDILGVSVDFWDTTRHSGFSVESLTGTEHIFGWKGKYAGRMILYPHCELELLQVEDIPRHFHGMKYRDSTLKELHSSMLLSLPKSQEEDATFGLTVSKLLAELDGPLHVPESILKDHWTADISMPSQTERKYVRKMESDCPNQSLAIVDRSSTSFDVRYIPVLRSSKFLIMAGGEGEIADMGSDDAHLSPDCTEIPLASNFGQVLLAILCCIPMKAKINLLKTGSKKQEASLEKSGVSGPVTFHLPNGSSLSLAELAMIAASSEIADEIYSCSGLAERMKLLASAIQEDVESFAPNSSVILQGLKLVKKEVKERQSRVSNARVSLAGKEIKHHISSIKHAFHQVKAEEDGSKLSLVPLNYLLSSEYFHRCHQLWLDDDQDNWNLVGV